MKCEKSYGSDTAALEKLMSCISGLSDVTSDFREVRLVYWSRVVVTCSRHV